MRETRVYPTRCTSAFCDKVSAECPGCPSLPVLAEFTAWRARTNAKCADHIWSPLVWISQEDDES